MTPTHLRVVARIATLNGVTATSGTFVFTANGECPTYGAEKD